MLKEFIKVEVPIIDVSKIKTPIGEYEITPSQIAICDSCQEVTNGILDKGYMYVNKADKKDRYFEAEYKCEECSKRHGIDQYI